MEIIVGIDVSKDRLDVHVLPSGEALSVENDHAGVEDLVRRLTALIAGRCRIGVDRQLGETGGRRLGRRRPGDCRGQSGAGVGKAARMLKRLEGYGRNCLKGTRETPKIFPEHQKSGHRCSRRGTRTPPGYQ